MARGYSALGDVMARTADGRDLNELYNELQQAAQIQNEQQQSFLSLFTHATTGAVTSVLQTLGASDAAFEKYSEYGIPTSKRLVPNVLDMGATFDWYDNRWAATWMYLMNATSAEIESAANAIIAADQDLVFNKVMATIFGDANRTVVDSKTGTNYTAFAFANSDGWVPPTYAGNSFDGTHTHYRTSGAATVDSGDLDEIVSDFKTHGYSEENGSQIVIFVNPAEGDVISQFRVATGAKADFIPASGARFYTPNQLVGDQPSATFAGFPVKGAYDEALIIESSRIPVGYMAALASGGALVPQNPIMLREHDRLKGLQLIPGKDTYPLQDSYWVRGFGTGVRHRLAGLVMQISTNASYSAPALYAA